MAMALEKHFLRRGWVLGVRANGLACGAATCLTLACGSGDDGAGGPASSPETDTMQSMASMPGDMNMPSGDAPPTGNGSGSPQSMEAPMNVGVTGNGGGSMGPAGDDSTQDPVMEPEMPMVPPDPRPFFSFFVTSQAGLFGLPEGEFAPAPDPALGYGGNLGGLAGADEICTMLARQASPGDNKTWRAFLSTSGFDGAERVDAIDRIGPGPWFNFNGLKLADDVEGLLPPEGDDGRPQDADPQLANMFTDENGEDSRPSQQIDNHDTLTGSGRDGRLFDDGEDGEVATCEDWTSNTLRGNEGGFMGADGQVPVGHMWPRNNANGRQWIQDHTINGCEPGFDIDGGGGAAQGDFRVGAGGGYGAIYCFALDAVPPAAD